MPHRATPESDDLIRALYAGLHRFASAVAPLGDDPDDLVQEALIRTLARRQLTELTHPHAYLRRAVLNLAKNRRRTLQRQLAALVRLGPPTADTDAYPSDTAALLTLPPTTRAVLWLADVEGLPFAQIADELGLTVEAARQRAVRGRAELKDRLEQGAT